MRIMWLVGAIAMVGCSVNVGSTFCEEDADCPRGYSCVTEDNKCVEGVDPPSCSRDVAAGGAHTCSVRNDGSVWCWGRNNRGQLGNDTAIDAVKPVQVVGIANATTVVTGALHSCALIEGGEVRCWGDGDFRQLGNMSGGSRTPVSVEGVSGIRMLVAGGFHTCALDMADTVWCWGKNDRGQSGSGDERRLPMRVDDVSAVAIAAGEESTCAINAMGNVLYCWGSNSDGRLGLGDGAPVTVVAPTLVPDASGVEAVAMGKEHTCIVIAGDVRCTGFNDHGQLGIGTTEQSNTFRPVEISAPIVGLALGGNHSCARDDRSRMWCWGDSGFGQFAAGTTDSHPWPVQSALPNVDQISAGMAHVCVRNGAAVWCSGNNAFGQLGNGERTSRGAPQLVPGVTGAVKVAAGARFSCSLGADKTARCWGENNEGELGDGTFRGRATPAPLELANIDQLVAGTDHACAITNNELWCWGWNRDGQLGDGTRNTRRIPGRVPGIKKPIAVAVGDAHTCAIDDDAAGSGLVKCWGNGDEGQLGGAGGSATPVIVSQLTLPAISIAAGAAHSCAILTDETVWCWGLNTSGQLGISQGMGSAIPVQVVGVTGASDVRARGKTTLVRLASGAVRSWGYGCEGQLGVSDFPDPCSRVPIPQSVRDMGVSAISMGHDAGCALEEGGTVACWGPNWFGQLGDGTYAEAAITAPVRDLTGAVDISSGGEHACAAKEDGTVVCWGHGISGQLGDGAAGRAAAVPALLVCE